MKNLKVYDPAMCCSSGVCGPDVDPALAVFSADLAWLCERGVEVERFNLATEPQAFVENGGVREILDERGDKALPLLFVDGLVVLSGAYPTRAQLAAWCGLVVENTKDVKSLGCCGSSSNEKSGCC